MELPGGMDEAELNALRRLQRELGADGYRVLKVGFSGAGPMALVARREDTGPLRSVVVAARSILRLVNQLPAQPSVSPEEYETLAALAVTSRTLLQNADVPGVETLADAAREQLGDAVREGMDVQREMAYAEED